MAGSCVEPYFPGDLDYEPMLFIQATVTDNPDIRPRVELSNTQPLKIDENEIIPYVNVSGATVYIESDDAARYYFTEEGYGLNIWSAAYYLPDPSFALEQGKSYMLVVETVEGYRFESGYEPYILPDEIDAIGYEHVSEQKSELEDYTEGYKFNISTTGGSNETDYYRWELDCTYHFMVSLQAVYMWSGSRLIDSMSHSLTYCYKDEDVKGIYIGSTAGLSEKRIVEEPLHFVSQNGYMLQIEYSLRAYQYHISQEAFQFWYDLRTLLYETGGLYETQPFKISGNMQCVSDPPVNVAGIFEVAGVSEKRIFVQRPKEFTVYTERCVPDTIGTPDFPWDMVQPWSWIIDNDDGVFQTAPNDCFDCTLSGGYTSRPPFWEK